MIESKGGTFRRLVLPLCMATLAANSWAAESAAPASPGVLDNGMISLTKLVPTITRVSAYSGDIWERSTLLGDLGGTRSDWYDKGFTLDMQVTQVYQGVTSGGSVAGNGNDKYNGLMEINASLGHGQAGLVAGWHALHHGYDRLGQSHFGRGGQYFAGQHDAAVAGSVPKHYGSDRILPDPGPAGRDGTDYGSARRHQLSRHQLLCEYP